MGLGILLIGVALAALVAPMHDETARDTSSCGTLLHPEDRCDASSAVYQDQLTSVVLLSLAGSACLVYAVVPRRGDPAPRADLRSAFGRG
jgi:hypothetical protein